MKPVIGITPTAQTDALPHGTFRRYVLSAPYVRAVEAAGGIPLILPPQSENIQQIASLVDGLLLSGGSDVDPMRYGDVTVHPDTYGIDGERDQFELDLFSAVLEVDKPIFGICRGMQVINVALGGTLIQDVSTLHPGAADIGHRQHERGIEDSEAGHSVVASEPELLPIFECGRLEVNSFHHQAVRDLAPDLAPVAYSPDGLVEAIVLRGRPSVFAVQWHPELMYVRHGEHIRGFVHLVEEAEIRKLAAVAT